MNLKFHTNLQRYILVFRRSRGQNIYRIKLKSMHMNRIACCCEHVNNWGENSIESNRGRRAPILRWIWLNLISILLYKINYLFLYVHKKNVMQCNDLVQYVCDRFEFIWLQMNVVDFNLKVSHTLFNFFSQEMHFTIYEN